MSGNDPGECVRILQSASILPDFWGMVPWCGKRISVGFHRGIDSEKNMLMLLLWNGWIQFPLELRRKMKRWCKVVLAVRHGTPLSLGAQFWGSIAAPNLRVITGIAPSVTQGSEFQHWVLLSLSCIPTQWLIDQGLLGWSTDVKLVAHQWSCQWEYWIHNDEPSPSPIHQPYAGQYNPPVSQGHMLINHSVYRQMIQVPWQPQKSTTWKAKLRPETGDKVSFFFLVLSFGKMKGIEYE